MDKQIDLFDDIKEFHEKFDVKPLDKPALLSNELMKFRVDFIQEELDELQTAYMYGNLEEVFDALIDIVYVALGTAYVMKLPFNKGWQEVHACNMKKIRVMSSDESKRNSNYDVIKPVGWKKPNLTKILKNI